MEIIGVWAAATCFPGPGFTKTGSGLHCVHYCSSPYVDMILAYGITLLCNDLQVDPQDIVMTVLCGLIGLPPSNGVIPQSLMHTKSLVD
ncbi:putative boron transporter 7 [Camellia lanceoleosa]|uniref:Boron transporter 7 n=1 Tax=Camellia lanceoleosa TaxID=1840588 RepID=A0ACC0FMH3_9ERIC|nr:putative boron transporter 7 [Camellia lanceoleosa]